MRTKAYGVRLSRAIDLYMDELHAELRDTTCRSYERHLMDFARKVDPTSERLVVDITYEDCMLFLRRWQGKKPTTYSNGVSLLRGFFAFLEEHGHIPSSPAAKLKRRKRQNALYVPVVTVSEQDVARIISACRNYQELICVGAAGYLARRRTALANARRADADLDNGFVRFVDKGGKTIEQPIPDEFLEVLRQADAHGVWESPHDWLIPPRRKATTGTDRRQSKVVYETIVKVAERAGVRAHQQALRAAFAVHFLKAKPGRIESLKELMGHDRLETTMVYLRRMDRATAMEDVRDLSWGTASLTGSSRVAENMANSRQRRIRDSNPCSRDLAPINEKLEELRAEAREKRGARRR